MDEKKRQRIFFGVIAVATLIIAMMGTSIAFFTATKTGTENGVSATADVVSISYSDSKLVTANALIPATNSVVKLGYKQEDDKQCVDDNSKQICSVYSFTVKNDGTNSKDIVGKLTIVENEFTYLKYIVYEQGNDTPIVDAGNLSTAGKDVSIFGVTGESVYNKQTLEAGAEKTYDVVIYLAESGIANDAEQGAKFKATASISIDGGSNITGVIAEK